MQRFGYILLLLIVSFSALGSTEAEERDFNAKITPQFFQKIINQLFQNLESKNGHMEKVFSNQTFEIKNLNFKTENALVNEHGKQLLGLNLNDNNILKVRADIPYIRGNVRIDKPVIEQVSDSVFDVSLKINIHNYYFDIRRLWIQEMNLTERDVSKNEGCGKELDNINWKNFLAPLKGASKEFEESLWARVDNIHLGYAKIDPTFTDKSKKFVIDTKLRFYLNNPKKSFEILNFSSDLGKKDGAYLNPHFVKSNIVIPPLFIKTLRRVYIDGLPQKDESGKYISHLKCTEIDTEPLKDYLVSFKSKITSELNSQVAALFTGELLNKLNEVTEDFREKSIPLNYKHKFAEGDLPDSVSESIGNLSELQFDANEIDIDEKSNIILAIDSKILIDGDYLSNSKYKIYPNKKLNYVQKTNFVETHEDFALGVSGKLFESIIKQISEKISEKPRKLGLNVNVDINNYSITDDGYIKFTPYLYGSKGDYKVFSLFFNFYVKPKIYLNKNNERKLGYTIKLPDPKTIVGDLSAGKIIKYSNAVSKIVVPFKKWVIDPVVTSEVEEMIKETFDEIKLSFKSITLDTYVHASGLVPNYIQVSKSGSIVFYFKIQESKLIEYYVSKLKENLGLEE